MKETEVANGAKTGDASSLLPNWASLASCAEMARALVLQLLLAGAAAMPKHPAPKADDPIPSHLRGLADAPDHATSHSHDPHPIDEEVADAPIDWSIPADLQLA